MPDQVFIKVSDLPKPTAGRGWLGRIVLRVMVWYAEKQQGYFEREARKYKSRAFVASVLHAEVMKCADKNSTILKRWKQQLNPPNARTQRRESDERSLK